MRLHYLDFDFSDEETGRGSFDAMASVTADRLPALRAEIEAVLRWCAEVFGPGATRDADADVDEWDHALETVESDDDREAAARTTLTFTLSGSPAFCDAFREEFEIDA